MTEAICRKREKTLAKTLINSDFLNSKGFQLDKIKFKKVKKTVSFFMLKKG